MSGAFSLRAALILAATLVLPPAGGAGAPPGVVGSAAAPGAPGARPEAPESPCSDARSLFMRVVTLTAFWKVRNRDTW